jgi:hypothetical protein
MTIVKVNDGKYINLDRMTYTEPSKKGGLFVHFAVGGGAIGGPSCWMELNQAEASTLRKFLDSQTSKA